MTTLQFYKYQATGNDFIMVDNRDNTFNPEKKTIAYLCDRKFGIGSDGLILIQNHKQYDFEMVFYNPDGSQSLCGNGSRCAVNFAKKLGILTTNTIFLAYDGPHTAEVLPNNDVRLMMQNVQNVRELEGGMFVDTGSPHLVKFVDHVTDYPVYQEGHSIRYSEPFRKTGVNINFVEIKGKSKIYVRTYERGVENETLSCGTGVTAAAIAASYHEQKSPVMVETRGGSLQVEFNGKGPTNYDHIYLIGPAEEVFSGTIDLNY